MRDGTSRSSPITSPPLFNSISGFINSLRLIKDVCFLSFPSTPRETSYACTPSQSEVGEASNANSTPDTLMTAAENSEASISSQQAVAVQLVEFNQNEWPYAEDNPRQKGKNPTMSSTEDQHQSRQVGRTRSAPASATRREAQSKGKGNHPKHNSFSGASRSDALQKEQRNERRRQFRKRREVHSVVAEEAESERETEIEKNGQRWERKAFEEKVNSSVVQHASFTQVESHKVNRSRRYKSCKDQATRQQAVVSTRRARSMKSSCSRCSTSPCRHARAEEVLDLRPVPKERTRRGRSQSLRVQSESYFQCSRPSPRPRPNTVTAASRSVHTATIYRNAAIGQEAVSLHGSRASLSRPAALHIDLTGSLKDSDLNISPAVTPESYVIDL